MVMVKFKENGRCGVFNLEQIKIRPLRTEAESKRDAAIEAMNGL